MIKSAIRKSPLIKRIGITCRRQAWRLIIAPFLKRNRDPFAAECEGNLADEFAFALKTNTLDAWYPAAIDTQFGGFLSDFSHCWKPTGPQRKMIVTQARHVWSTSKAATFYPEEPRYLSAAAHGVEFLRNVMWDRELGGFRTLATREGTPIPSKDGRFRKTAYGNAFGIFALAAYHQASGNAPALELAKDAFHWLDRHGRDPAHQGYFRHLERDGTAMVAADARHLAKDANSTIHLLEAFTELYRAWPDALLRRRLSELLHLVRDRISSERGYMNLYFDPDWAPAGARDGGCPGRSVDVSFGHDLEAAFLMIDAMEALGDGADARTLRRAKALVDHALRQGWDERKGGFFDRGRYRFGEAEPTITRESKVWWVQAEGLHTLKLMLNRFPDDRPRYLEKFEMLWKYIKNHLVDYRNGGWYQGGLDREPWHYFSPKGTVWKVNYHSVRALMRCARPVRAVHPSMSATSTFR